MSTTKTEIAWTDRTWNPVRGCSRVSPGCDNCYAMKVAYRFKGPGLAYEGLATLRKGKADWTGIVRTVPDALSEPLSWRKPARIFVNSQSDLFHHSVKDVEIDRVFAVMALARWHTFQILTKRAERMASYTQGLTFERLVAACNLNAEGGEHGPGAYSLASLAMLATKARIRLGYGLADLAALRRPPLPNVWLGVSAEDQKYADERIPHLLATPAAVHFVSAEPLLGPINLSRYMPAWFCDECGAFMVGRGDDGCDPDEGEASPCCSKCSSLRVRHATLDWVIVGGESGGGARPFDVAWARGLVRQCREADVACFVKQLGAQPIEDVPLPPYPDGRPRNGRGLIRLLKDRKGGDPAEWPDGLNVRQFPEARP